jgi:hypothetical protein
MQPTGVCDGSRDEASIVTAREANAMPPGGPGRDHPTTARPPPIGAARGVCRTQRVTCCPTIRHRAMYRARTEERAHWTCRNAAANLSPCPGSSVRRAGRYRPPRHASEVPADRFEPSVAQRRHRVLRPCHGLMPGADALVTACTRPIEPPQSGFVRRHRGGGCRRTPASQLERRPVRCCGHEGGDPSAGRRPAGTTGLNALPAA